MNLLKNRQGSAIIWAPVILLVLMTFFASLFEHSRLNTIAANTNDAVQAALTQVCTDNTKQVYSGVREGYSGGYKLESTSWTPDVTSSDILSKVDAKLGTSGGVKTSDGKLVYQISDLSVNVDNAPLAPTDTDGAEQLTGMATYTLTVPLSFGWSALPPMTIRMEAESGYSQQGDLRGGGDSTDMGPIPVDGIALSMNTLTLSKGDTDVIAASVIPDDAEDRSITWASTDSNVCSVTNTGVVTAVNNGSASVLALSGDGQMASCDVTVVSPVTGVSLDKSSISMIPGATEQLTATVSPADATNNGVNWVSSNPSVCTVDSSGKVMAVGAGQSTITVMTQEGGYYAECVVKVTIPVTGITMDKTALTIAKGGTDTLVATIWPGNATRQDVLWASSDSLVCTVDQSGNIAAIGVGSAVISATTEDGQYVATCNINVIIPVTGVSVSPSSLELIKGNTGTVTATVSPSDATDQTVFWTSSDSNIASVDSSGTISANNVGTATITARTEDGGYMAFCSVTVKPNTYTVTAIAGDGGSVSGGGVYQVGSDVTLTATPDEHYHFDSWTDEDGNVIGTGKNHTIYNLSADTTVFANFEIDTFTVTVNASTGGTATGGGTYPYGTVATLTAMPDADYQFSEWSDGNLENPRSYTVTEDITLTALFTPIAIAWTEQYSNTSESTVYTAYASGTMAGTSVNGTTVYTFDTPIYINSIDEHWNVHASDPYSKAQYNYRETIYYEDGTSSSASSYWTGGNAYQYWTPPTIDPTKRVTGISAGYRLSHYKVGSSYYSKSLLTIHSKDYGTFKLTSINTSNQ